MMNWRMQEELKPESNFVTVFPGGSDGRASTCNAGDLGSIPGLGRSPGGGHGNPLQYSCLENPHGWRSLAGCSPWVHKESDTTELSLYCVKKEMATLSSNLARKISWTEEPGGIQSTVSQRVGHNWVTKQLCCQMGHYPAWVVSAQSSGSQAVTAELMVV